MPETVVGPGDPGAPPKINAVGTLVPENPSLLLASFILFPSVHAEPFQVSAFAVSSVPV